MNNFIFSLILIIGFYSSAQISITPNPSSINAGVITITYGANNNYSLFDPMGNPSLLLYTGLQTDNDVTTWDYHDDFSDPSTYVPFNYDATANAYVAQIDVAGRMYQEEPSLNVVNIPAGTIVYDWYFLIITTDLSRQSADLKATDYGWQAATLSTDNINVSDFDVVVVKDGLVFSKSGFYSIQTFNLHGQLVQDINRRYIERELDMSNLNKDTLYISRITSSNGSKVVKHIY